MLGAIIQATKSMEVGTPNFKNLEVYTETVAVAKGVAPAAEVPALCNSIEGLIALAVIFGCCYTRDCYLITTAFSEALPYCRHLAEAQ
jgi:hypothetical protein